MQWSETIENILM